MLSDNDRTATSATLLAGSTTGPFTVTATSDGAPPVTFTEAVTEATKVRADLASGLSAPDSVRIGTAFKATLTVTNRGPTAATKTFAVLELPSGIKVNDTGGGKAVRGAVIVDVGTLSAGSSLTRTVTLVATPTSSGKRILCGLSLSATPDPSLVNNLSRKVIAVR